MAKREVVVTFKMTKAGVDLIEALRGQWSRSEYIRRAVRHYAVDLGTEGPRVQAKDDL